MVGLLFFSVLQGAARVGRAWGLDAEVSVLIPAVSLGKLLAPDINFFVKCEYIYITYILNIHISIHTYIFCLFGEEIRTEIFSVDYRVLGFDKALGIVCSTSVFTALAHPALSAMHVSAPRGAMTRAQRFSLLNPNLSRVDP